MRDKQKPANEMGLIALNKELDELKDKTDQASRDRFAELLDALMNRDMGMGPMRKAMCRGEKTKPDSESQSE